MREIHGQWTVVGNLAVMVKNQFNFTGNTSTTFQECRFFFPLYKIEKIRPYLSDYGTTCHLSAWLLHWTSNTAIKPLQRFQRAATCQLILKHSKREMFPYVFRSLPLLSVSVHIWFGILTLALKEIILITSSIKHWSWGVITQEGKIKIWARWSQNGRTNRSTERAQQHQYQLPCLPQELCSKNNLHIRIPRNSQPYFLTIILDVLRLYSPHYTLSTLCSVNIFTLFSHVY